MASCMNVHATWASTMRFNISTSSGHELVLDMDRDGGGDDAGARPMEMLLAGLAGCAGMDIISILRKMRQDVIAYEVHIYSTSTEEYPRVFTRISVEHLLTGSHIKAEAVQRAIDLTEARYCGVSSMLAKTATIVHTFSVREP